MKFPETFTSMKAKMNSNVSFAIENMNTALKDLCEDTEAKPSAKLKATQEYLALYMRLENEVQREKDGKENYKQNKLNTVIKQHQVDKLENPDGDVPDTALKQSKFSPTMSSSFN